MFSKNAHFIFRFKRKIVITHLNQYLWEMPKILQRITYNFTYWKNRLYCTENVCIMLVIDCTDHKEQKTFKTAVYYNQYADILLILSIPDVDILIKR